MKNLSCPLLTSGVNIGFLPLLLALIAIFAWKDRRKRPLIILAMFCLIIVLYTPLRSFVYDRFLLVYIFAMSVLAAYGADALLEHRLDLRSLNRPLKIICGLVICVGVSVVAGSLVFWIFKETFLERSHRFLSQFIAGRFLGYHLPLHIQKLDFTIQSLMITSPRMLLPLLIAAGSIAVVYQSMKRRLSKKTIAFLIVIISASDLSYMAATHIPFVDLKKYPLFPKADLITLMQEDKELFRVATVFRPSKEAPVLSRAMLEPYGIQSIDGSDNVSSPWSLVNMANVQSQSTYNIPINLQLLDVQNVKYLLTSKSVELPHEQFDVIYDKEMRVYQNLQVMPRAFVVYNYEVVADLVALKARLNSQSFDPRSTVLLEEIPEFESRRNFTTTDPQVTVVSYQPQRVDLQVSTSSPGILVLADTYYPGWTATLDGKPTNVLRANFGMRAVQIPTGNHDIRFSFVPFTFKVGLFITLGTLAGALLLAGLGRQFQFPRREANRC
jgi:hypothetical protein